MEGGPQQVDVQMNSAVGITSYQESFAVDPNEILQKDFSRFQQSGSKHSTGLIKWNTFKVKNISLMFIIKKLDSYFSDNNSRIAIKTEVDMKPALGSHQDSIYPCALSNMRYDDISEYYNS